MPDKSVMRMRLRQDIEELKTLEGEIAEVEHEVSCAMETYKQTHLRLSNLRRHYQMLFQRKESTIVLLNTLATFPRELLSLIFAFACKESKDMYSPGWRDTVGNLTPTMWLDKDRIATPWRIGLVCRHWRDVVLSTRDAWSYIGISFTPGAGPDVISTESMQCHYRVQAALEKSGSAPLDVVISYRGSNKRGTGEGAGRVSRTLLQEEHNFFYYIFSMLHANMHRVRSLHVQASNPLPAHWRSVPTGSTTTREKVENLLRGSCPSLVDLRVSFGYGFADLDPDVDEFWHGFPEQPVPLFLPHAPKLRTLSLHNVPIVCRRPHPGLPSLRRLSIRQACMYTAHMADMIACAPNLEYLFFNVTEALEADDDTINMERASHVLTLNIDSEGDPFELLADGAYLFPSLTDLRIPNLSPLRTVSDHLARGLKKLCVWMQENLEEHLDTLRQLAAIEEVEFEQGCSMHDGVFFAPLCEAEYTMWPELRVLKLSAVLLSVEKDGLLQLVRARNSKDGPAVARPLERVDFSLTQQASATWLEAPIRAIIPEAK